MNILLVQLFGAAGGLTLDTEAVPRYNENILRTTRKGGKHGGKSGVDLRGEAGQSADRHSRRPLGCAHRHGAVGAGRRMGVHRKHRRVADGILGGQGL